MAISVMPDSGDQLVRPMHSERITPAIQTHSVPSSAMIRPRSRVISGTDNSAMISISRKPPSTAK